LLPDQRQAVTGVVVNDKLNWPRDRRRWLRQEVYYLRRFGFDNHVERRGIKQARYKEFLYGHEAIADVQVIGVPDARFGEELMASVVLKPGATLDEEGLRAFCRGRIAHYKVPRYVSFVESFPMTVTGKVQKFKMREQAIADLGLEVAETA